VLRRKLVNVGFEAVEVIERRPFGLAALGLYPVFPAEFLDFVRRVVPPEHHDTLIHAVVVTAGKGGERP
jgi:hypothetical protein